MIVTVGKSSDNDLVVEDEYVSRHHARLIYEEKNSSWLLEDLESTNGTYVNDMQIVRKRVHTEDIIRLGTTYTFTLSDALKAVNDYSEEFLKLKDVYDTYIKEKVKIQSSNQFKTRILQTIPFALTGCVGVIIGFLGKGSPLFLFISLAVAVCAPIVGIYLGAKQSSKTPELLQNLTNQFKIDYVCPKCGIFLGEIPWESLKNRKQCSIPTCKAKWVD